jgi:hypothetical protein
MRGQKLSRPQYLQILPDPGSVRVTDEMKSCIFKLTKNIYYYFKIGTCIGPRRSIYSGYHSSPAMHTVVFIMYVSCDLKLYLNHVELGTGAARARLFPRKEVIEASVTFGWGR